MTGTKLPSKDTMILPVSVGREQQDLNHIMIHESGVYCSYEPEAPAVSDLIPQQEALLTVSVACVHMNSLY